MGYKSRDFPDAIDFFLPVSMGAFLASTIAEAGSTVSLCVVIISGVSFVSFLLAGLLRNLKEEREESRDRICDEWERENGFHLGPQVYMPDEDDGGKAG